MSKFAIAAITVLSSLISASATLTATVVYDSGTLALSASGPTQSGVLTQSGVPSDWSTPPRFPGVDNPSAPFSYDALPLPTSPFAYLQINFLDLSDTQSLFASAYLNSYDPASSGPDMGLSINYLGDEGLSGNSFGNAAAFQVILPNPVSDHVVLVVTDESGAPGGSGQQFNFLVEGFTDTSFDDSTAAPEPSSAAFLSAALGLAVLVRLRHCKVQRRQISSSRS